MNKKTIMCIIIGVILLAVLIVIILNSKRNVRSVSTNNASELDSFKKENTTETTEREQVVSEVKEDNIDMIKIRVNSNVLEVKLEDNEATKSLIEKLKSGSISVDANEYGGFEKVGDLGFSLPHNDKRITTSAGDIVLYQGDQVSIFYNSNSWSYTKLGKVQNVSESELKDILGSGDVTLIFSMN